MQVFTAAWSAWRSDAIITGTFAWASTVEVRWFA